MKQKENHMRGKKFTALMLCLATAMSLAACGKPKTSMDIKYKVSDYVTLDKNYKKLKVTLSGDYSTEAALQEMLDSAGGYDKDESQTTVAEDSIVNVDYVGKLDGTAFDGGSAQDQTIDVKNNCQAGSGSSYIDGFTSGLVGAKVGTTVDCPVTFPENYSSTDLAGKAVVFTFTVNYICKKMDMNSLTDDYVKSKFNLDSVDALKESAKTKALEKKKSDTRDAVTDQLIQGSKIKFPKDLLSMRLKEYEDRFTDQYTNGASLKDYLKKNNMTVKDFESKVKQSLKKNLETELVLEAVADKEGIKLDKKGYKKFVDNLMDNNSLKSKDDLYQLIAPDSKSGEAYLKKMYVCQKACDFCVDHARVSVE
jgi:trigger factor